MRMLFGDAPGLFFFSSSGVLTAPTHWTSVIRIVAVRRRKFSSSGRGWTFVLAFPTRPFSNGGFSEKGSPLRPPLSESGKGRNKLVGKGTSFLNVEDSSRVAKV